MRQRAGGRTRRRSCWPRLLPWGGMGGPGRSCWREGSPPNPWAPSSFCPGSLSGHDRPSIGRQTDWLLMLGGG
eukprot:8132523-Pyramimonas_sp.AAC.1